MDVNVNTFKGDTVENHLCMLTTIDNPFDPYDESQWNDWLAFDQRNGYYCNELVAREIISSESLSDLDIAIAQEEAINRIVSLNVSGKFKKLLPPNKRNKNKN